MHRTVGGEPTLPRPSEPTSSAPAEGFERSICEENFDADTRHWVDIEER